MSAGRPACAGHTSQAGERRRDRATSLGWLASRLAFIGTPLVIGQSHAYDVGNLLVVVVLGVDLGVGSRVASRQARGCRRCRLPAPQLCHVRVPDRLELGDAAAHRGPWIFAMVASTALDGQLVDSFMAALFVAIVLVSATLAWQGLSHQPSKVDASSPTPAYPMGR